MRTKSGRLEYVRAGIVGLMGLALIACGVTSGGPPSSPSPANTEPGESGDGSAETQGANLATDGGTVSPVMAPGDHRENFTSGGVVRRYLLHVPTGYDGSKALPLVFVLHGHGGNAVGMEKATGMDQTADAKGFIVAYLNGTSDPQGWNTGITPELAITVDDGAFVRDLAEHLEGELNIDKARIYAAGFSNGAMMTHRLAAELPDLLAGAAMVEGTIGTQQADGTYRTISVPAGPIPVLIIHGKHDGVVTYDGIPRPGSDKPVMKSAADAVSLWTQADGCSGSPQVTTSSDGNVTTEDYVSCTAGAEVELISIVSGVHEWPTLNDKAKFNGTDAVWEFLSRHAKPGP